MYKLFARYFIIIDDLWSSSIWDVVSRAFPQSGCCSRIVTTTEIMEVALACCFCPGNTFKMEALSDNDSQKLLLQRILVFGNQSPQQFDDVVPQIVRSCGGLPLAIIIAARILASQPEKLEQWGSAHNSFDSIFGVNPTMEGFMGQILNICFINLPHYLKTCLLYLSTYPEGYLFLKDDLVKQWVAERFICVNEGEDMEEVARRYFDELVSMALIQVMDINCNYDLFYYSVHQLVHDFITYKSIEENFITVVDYSQTKIRLSDKVRRLSLHFGSATYASAPASTSLSQVRSLFFSGLFNCMPSFVVFKLLRVIILHVWYDTGTTDLNLTGICELLRLRYLQVTCNITVKLPERIEAMKHLETLEINARVCDVPQDIVRLSSLLHLCLQGGNLPSGIGGIRSLRTLKNFDLGNSSEDSLWGLGELRNLQDLHLTYSSSPSSEHLKRNLIALSGSIGKLCNLKSLTLTPGTAGMVVLFGSSSNMSVPVFLEKLELLPPICIFSRLPKWIGQLRRICIMKVAVRELPTTDIAILTGLHSLTVLSLSVQIAPEGRITFPHSSFPVLKYFKFRCGVLCMSFMIGAMPNLRRLKLVFNIHTGERYGNMLVGIEHLLSLQDIVGKIGAATESDWRAAEFVINDAIDKHPMLPRRNLQWVDLVEEECRPLERHHWSQEKGSLSEKHGVLEKSAIHYSTKYHTPIRGKNMEPTDDETEYALSRLEMFSAGDTTSVFSDEADDVSSTQPSVINGDQPPFWDGYYYSSDDNSQGIAASSTSPIRGFGSPRSNSSLPPGVEDVSVGSDGQDEVRLVTRRVNAFGPSSSASDPSILCLQEFSILDSEEVPRNACGQELGTSASVSGQDPSAVRASPPTDPAFHSDLLQVLDKLRGMIAAIELQPRPASGGSGMVTRRVSRFFRLLELRITEKLPSSDADARALRRNDHTTTGSASWPMASLSSGHGHGEWHSVRPQKKPHCLPVLGGAPFVLCSGCLGLLQLPTSILPSRRRGNIRLRCGWCDQVLEFRYAAPPGIAGRDQTGVTTLGNTSKSARATQKKKKKA